MGLVEVGSVEADLMDVGLGGFGAATAAPADTAAAYTRDHGGYGRGYGCDHDGYTTNI